MTFDRKTLVIPDKTTFEERSISTKGDVVIGDRCLLQFSIDTDGRIFVGEHVITGGNLNATNDVRVDIFSEISGNIQSGGNVYLGEKVKVKGKLSLKDIQARVIKSDYYIKLKDYLIKKGCTIISENFEIEIQRDTIEGEVLSGIPVILIRSNNELMIENWSRILARIQGI